MALSLFHSLLCIFVLLNCFKLHTCSLLEDVCRHTTRVDYCFEVLKSDPRTAKADLPGLAQVSLDLSLSKARGTLEKITTLLSKETDPQYRARYTTCKGKYNEALGALSIAREQFNPRNLRALSTTGHIVFDDSSDCENAFPYPATKSPITEGNENFKSLGDILGAIAHL